jgi:chromosome segregation ATPase
MADITDELEACRAEAATLGKLIQERNTFFLQREQELSDAISNVASRIRVMESSTPVTVEDIKKCGADAAVRLANLAERAAEFAVQLRKKRTDESLAATAVGRLSEYMRKLEGALAVPEQLVRSNYRCVANLRAQLVEWAKDFQADIGPDGTEREIVLRGNTNNNTGGNDAAGDVGSDGAAGTSAASSAVVGANGAMAAESLRRAAQAFADVSHSATSSLAQKSAFGIEYIAQLEAELKKMRSDSQEQQAALDEARSVLETTDAVYRGVHAEREAKAVAVKAMAEQLRKERAALEKAVAAAGEPSRTSSELAADLAKLQRRRDTLGREIAESESQLATATQRCDIAGDALVHVKEAIQRATEAKSTAMRRKADAERTIRELQDATSKHENDVRVAQQRAEAATADAQHLRDAISATQQEKEVLAEDEKKAHRQLAKTEYEAGLLRDQEEDLGKRIATEKDRADQFAQRQRDCNIERAKMDQEVHIKTEQCANLRQQLQYVRSLLPTNHPLRSNSSLS